MNIRSSKTQSPDKPLVSAEFIFWWAAAVLGYSLIVPLLALDSMRLAESLLQFGLLHQAAMLLLVLLAGIRLFGQTLTRGWEHKHWPSVVALCLLLMSVQPATECCTKLVAGISGMIPFSEVTASDLGLHLAPIVGCGLLMFNIVNSHKPVPNNSPTSNRVIS